MKPFRLFLPHRYTGPLLTGRFIRRPNRFVAEVELEQGTVRTHVPDPGRLKELLQPGAEVYVCSPARPSRKIPYTLLLVRASNPPYALVSLDTPSANRLAEQVLKHPKFSPLGTPWQVQREIKIGESRLDFYLHQNTRELFLEVKSVSLVIGQIALFPDAPTLRGVRHLHDLINLTRQGKQSALLFVAQRADLISIRPNKDTDPHFAEALKEAHRQGVQLFGIKFQVSLKGYTYQGAVPVEV